MVHALIQKTSDVLLWNMALVVIQTLYSSVILREEEALETQILAFLPPHFQHHVR